jgi:hypothetical protein
MGIKKYRYASLSIETNEAIVFAEFNRSLVIDLPIAMEIVANRLEFTTNRQHYFIVDFSNVKHVSHEAKLYLQDPEGGLKNMLCSAFLASNPVSALLANIFVKTPKPIPSRFFSNKKDALKWIHELQQSVLEN